VITSFLARLGRTAGPKLFRPRLRSPWGCFRFRSVVLTLLVFGLAAPRLSQAQPKSGLRLPQPVDLVEAEKQGRALVADLLSQRPAQNSTNTGVMTIRPPDGKPRAVPIRFEITSEAHSWWSRYETPGAAAQDGAALVVTHAEGQPNRYLLTASTSNGISNSTPRTLAGADTMVPFAGSDFWVADLGLEFFHWPRQLVLRKELRRSRSCVVLESANPDPVPGGYSRVVSWIDAESGGIIHADAFDTQNELLKQFDPKDFKKVQGQWQLEGMEIRNRQTGSRTRIEFNLDSP
jgi:hypothetical protein